MTPKRQTERHVRGIRTARLTRVVPRSLHRSVRITLLSHHPRRRLGRVSLLSLRSSRVPRGLRRERLIRRRDCDVRGKERTKMKKEPIFTKDFNKNL